MKLSRVVRVVFALLTALVAMAPSAGAQSPTTPTTVPTVTTLAGATAIDRNMAFTGATITSAADPTPRSLNGYQAAVFVQSWLPTALFGKPELRDPPAELPVYRVDINGSWGGDVPQVGNQTVYYASDGTTAFVSYPQGQEVTPTPSASPLPPTVWFIAPTRTMDAFNGQGTLVDTAGTENAKLPRTPNPQPTGSGSSSSSTQWVLFALLAVAVVVVIAGVVMFVRRAPTD